VLTTGREVAEIVRTLASAYMLHPCDYLHPCVSEDRGTEICRSDERLELLEGRGNRGGVRGVHRKYSS